MSRLIPAAWFVSLSLFGSIVEAKPALDAAAQEDATTRIEKALDAPAIAEYLDVPLGDVADDLSLRYNIPVELDHEALGAEGLGADSPITKDLQGVSLANVLNQMLLPMNMDWTVRDEALLITTPAGAGAAAITKVYPVAQLAVRAGFDHHDLINVVQRMISPNDWRENGGTVGALAWNPVLRSLVVTTSYRDQRKVRALLDVLVRADEEKTSKSSDGLSVFPRDEIDKALRAKTSTQYLDTPLADVVTNLESLHGRQIEIDIPSLAAYGITDDLPITAIYKDVSLSVVLSRILRPRNLEWVVSEGCIMVTMKETASQPQYQQIRVYPVGDLVSADAWGKSASDLVETITAVVRPDDWAEIGGTIGDAVAFGPTKSLVVAHDEQGHRAIASLMKQLRAAKEKTAETVAQQDSSLTTKFYSIADLDAGAGFLGTGAGVETGGKRFVELTSVLVQTLQREVEPQRWGGAPGDADAPSLVVDELSRSLVIRQTAQGHRAVAAFLLQVRKDLNRGNGGIFIDEDPETDAEEEREIGAKLLRSRQGGGGYF